MSDLEGKSRLAHLLSTGVEHHRAGRFHDAELIYRQVLRCEPTNADALHLLGQLAHEAGRATAAIELIKQAIAHNSAAANYHCSLGIALQSIGKSNAAIASFRRAIELRPDYAEAHNNLGALCKAEGRLKDAVVCFREAVRFRPELAEAHYNLAVALHELGASRDAIVHLRTCVRLKPEFKPAQLALMQTPDGSSPNAIDSAHPAAEQHFAEAHQLVACGRIEDAVRLFQCGLALHPKSAAALNGLGNALQEIGRLDEAVAAYREALCLMPDYADAHCNLGNALQRANHVDESESCYQQALLSRPNHLAAHANLGVLYKDQGKLDQASEHIKAAMAVRPSGVLKVLQATLLPPVYDSVADLQQRRLRLEDNLRNLGADGPTFDLTQEVVPNLFYLAYQGFNDREIQRKLAEIYTAGSRSTGDYSSSRSTGTIKLGILSKYLRDHTIGTLMRGLFAKLSRDEFRVTALVFDAARDLVTDFIRQHADEYIVLPDNLCAARKTIANLRLDVLFFADIGMDPLTYTLAFTRFAPVQCVTWGHPVTSGIPTVDYFISSKLAEPPDAQDHYTEQLVQLDNLPFYYYKPAAPSPLKSREHFGLAAADHLYGCPQTLFKFHPEFDAILGGILRSDPKGRLVLIKPKHHHWEHLLRQRFAVTIPDVVERICWLPPQPRRDFLNLMAVCDCLLDPIHFGGGNTSYEGLALGIPIVTLPAACLRGRLTDALYRKIGVLDCVVRTENEYIERAVALVTDSSYRDAIRSKIIANCDALFEDAIAVAELETFFKSALKTG